MPLLLRPSATCSSGPGAWSRLSGWCVEVLDAAGLRCVTLKGPALAMQLYGDDVTRPSSDVDLLVARPELEHALAALGAAGLRFGTRHATWYERRWRHHLVAGGAPVDRGLPVEVHWSFGGPGLIAGPIERLFDDAVAVDCAGRRLPAPSLAWQLLVCRRACDPALLPAASAGRRRPDRRPARLARVGRRRPRPRAGRRRRSTMRPPWRPGASAPRFPRHSGLRPAPWRDAVLDDRPPAGRRTAFPRTLMQAMKAVVPLMITTSELPSRSPTSSPTGRGWPTRSRDSAARDSGLPAAAVLPWRADRAPGGEAGPPPTPTTPRAAAVAHSRHRAARKRTWTRPIGSG